MTEQILLTRDEQKTQDFDQHLKERFDSKDILVLEQPITQLSGEANFCVLCNPVVVIK